MTDRQHHIETKIYDNDGDLIKMSTVTLDGDYEYTQADLKYLDWLEENRSKRTIIEDLDK